MVQIFADPATLPPFHTRTGTPYHPLWQVVPALEPFYTEYEKSTLVSFSLGALISTSLYMSGPTFRKLAKRSTCYFPQYPAQLLMVPQLFIGWRTPAGICWEWLPFILLFAMLGLATWNKESMWVRVSSRVPATYDSMLSDLFWCLSTHRPLPVKRALAFWNLALSIVSFLGAVRVGSHLLYLLSPWGGYTFRDTICRCAQSLIPPSANHQTRQ